MIHVHAAAVKSINNAADVINKKIKNIKQRGDTVVELDQFKSILGTYEEPLNELRDSL